MLPYLLFWGGEQYLFYSFLMLGISWGNEKARIQGINGVYDGMVLQRDKFVNR